VDRLPSADVVASKCPERGDSFGGRTQQARRASVPHTPRTGDELGDRDHRRLADLERVAAERLAEIGKLKERGGQVDALLEDRARLEVTVEQLTGDVDRLSLELERIKSQRGWPQSGHSSPLLIPTSPIRRRPSPPVITELKQLLESNQVILRYIQMFKVTVVDN